MLARVTAATASAPRTRIPAWIAAVLAAAAAAWTFRGSLPYFFAQDDFLGLARARGIAPALAGPWRWVSGQAYFTLMRPLGLESAAPYHAASLALHALTAALLALLLARRVGTIAATAGAVFFAAHPSLYTALYSVSGVGEILSGLFAVVALLLVDRPDAARWLAPVSFAAALACKESVILLPLVVLFNRFAAGGGPAPNAPPRTGAPRLDATLATLAVAAAWAAYLFAADVFGVRSGLNSDAPYALAAGPHLLDNFLTYAGWAAWPWLAFARSFQDVAERAAEGAGLAALFVWLTSVSTPYLAALISMSRGLPGAATRWRPGPGLLGGLLFVALIAPVLPLPHHTYHYYLYAPLIGVAMCVAALFEQLGGAASVSKRGRVVAAGALAFAALSLWNGAAFVHRIETAPFTDPRQRADALVDRALIAGRIRDRLAAADLPPATPLTFWSPWALIQQARESGGTAPPGESYAESNVRAALMDGLAIRVLFPALGPATFAHRYQPPPRGARVVLYDVDGTGRIVTPDEVESMLAEHPIPGATP